MRNRCFAVLLLALATACDGAYSPTSSAPSAGSDGCQDSLPIESEAQAICRVRSLSNADAALGESATTYSAKRVGGVWRVSIAPPKDPYIGGGYVVDIDAASGEVVKGGGDH